MLQTFSVELAFYGGLFRISSFLCQSYVAACYDFATSCKVTTVGLIEPCRVQCIENSRTGGRMARVSRFIPALRA